MRAVLSQLGANFGGSDLDFSAQPKQAEFYKQTNIQFNPSKFRSNPIEFRILKGTYILLHTNKDDHTEAGDNL